MQLRIIIWNTRFYLLLLLYHVKVVHLHKRQFWLNKEKIKIQEVMTKKDAIKIFEDKKLCAVTSYTIHGLKIQ